jgi:hypothetical protein
MVTSLLKSLAAATILTVGVARCGMIVNGTPTTAGAGQAIDAWIGAQSFTVNSSFTLRGVEFAIEEYVPAGLGPLNYYIYSNNASSLPGTLLASGSNPAFSTSYLIDGNPFSVSWLLYDFNLNARVTLNAGTYWVALNFSNTSQSVGWTATTANSAPFGSSTSVGTTNWIHSPYQLYLGVSDTALVATVPEPASVALAGLALAALAGFRFRRSACSATTAARVAARYW